MSTKAMDEPLTHRAGLPLGDSHYEALAEESKRRFGRVNISPFLRIIVDEWYERLTAAAKDGKKK